MHVTSTWKQYLISFCHHGIGEYSTVHFSVTLQSKFWMSASRIWLFVDNFGAWKMQFGSLKSPWKVLEFCTLSLLRTPFPAFVGLIRPFQLESSHEMEVVVVGSLTYMYLEYCITGNDWSVSVVQNLCTYNSFLVHDANAKHRVWYYNFHSPETLILACQPGIFTAAVLLSKYVDTTKLVTLL